MSRLYVFNTGKDGAVVPFYNLKGNGTDSAPTPSDPAPKQKTDAQIARAKRKKQRLKANKKDRNSDSSNAIPAQSNSTDQTLAEGDEKASEDEGSLAAFKTSASSLLNHIPTSFKVKNPCAAQSHLKALVELLCKNAEGVIPASTIKALAQVIYDKLAADERWADGAAANVVLSLYRLLAQHQTVFASESEKGDDGAWEDISPANGVLVTEILRIARDNFLTPSSLKSSAWNASVPLFSARLYTKQTPDLLSPKLLFHLIKLMDQLIHAPALFTEHNMAIVHDLVSKMGRWFDMPGLGAGVMSRWIEHMGRRVMAEKVDEVYIWKYTEIVQEREHRWPEEGILMSMRKVKIDGK